MPITIEELNRSNCKTYLVSAGRDAALVDPVRERVETYRAALEARGLRLVMVLETHMHADHLMLNRSAKEALGVPWVMHRNSPSPLVDRHVDSGDVIRLGGESIEVVHTPGHTPDSICYRMEGAVLTGDTLMISTSGRTDFPGGDPGAQYDAVTKLLFELPEETAVWPAHDYKGRHSTTIGEEKRHSPRFAGKTRDEFITLMNNLALPMPDRLQQALQVNQSGFEADEVTFPLVAELATMPSLTAVEVALRMQASVPPLVIDVREPEEFIGELGHIEGALLIPMDAIEKRLPKLAGYVERDIVLVCRAGARSASACVILERAGFRGVFNLLGGMLAWKAAELPVEH